MSPGRFLLTERFARRAAQHPDRVLLHHRGRDWTYAELYRDAAAFARFLRDHGLRAGDRVALALPNSGEYVTAYFGTQLAGGCAVTLDTGQPGPELAYAIEHSGAAAAVLDKGPQERLAALGGACQGLRTLIATHPDGAPIAGTETVSMADVLRSDPLNEGVRPSAQDNAQIIYTSGTTGKPKGVVLTHGSLAANTDSIIESLSLREEDSVFAILAFSYSYGNSLLLTHVSCGGRIVAAADFVFWKDVLDLMQRERAAGFAGIPTSFAMLLNRSDFLRREWPDLRYLTCAGGALPVATIERLRGHLPAVRIYVMYGQTEASARLACLPPEFLESKLGSAGRAIPGVELTIRDDDGRDVPRGEVGEIVARGANLMREYHRDPEATAQVLRPDGLHTGDLARMDEEGFVYIVGRRDDVIKSGGYRVGPQEIEDALLQVEGVAEAGVTGVPDDVLGAVPVAFVVARMPDAGLVARIRAHLQSVLPRYKLPKDVHLVDALPRTSNGKLVRRRLRELLSDLGRPGSPGDARR